MDAATNDATAVAAAASPVSAADGLQLVIIIPAKLKLRT